MRPEFSLIFVLLTAKNPKFRIKVAQKWSEFSILSTQISEVVIGSPDYIFKGTELKFY